MAEYIARAAAIVDFERCNNENPVWTPQRVKTLLMRIPTADVEPVRRWIPCRKTLPNTRERVLATDGVFVGEMCINKRGQWQRYNIANYEILMSLDILAWMPLPEPPKEGDVENEAD